MLKDYAKLSSINEEQILPAKLVKQFKPWGFEGNVSKTTLGELCDWLYNVKHWLVIIEKVENGFTFHVESTTGDGVKYFDNTARTETDAVKRALDQAVIACRAKDEDDYYFPEN